MKPALNNAEQKTIHIKENSWIAKFAASRLKEKQVAFTFGKTIHLHGTTTNKFLSDQNWVCHEIAHVAQFERYGKLRFSILYLWELISRGYVNNKWEIEARGKENEVNVLRNYLFQ